MRGDQVQALYEAHRAEVQNAYGRLMYRQGEFGGPAASAMAWLCEFTETDLTQASEGRWTDLAYEVLCLTEGYGQDPAESLSRTPRAQLVSWGPVQKSGLAPWTPSRESIVRLHRTVKHQIQELLSGRPARFSVPKGTLEIWRGRTDNPIFSAGGDHPQDRFLYHAAQLVSAFCDGIYRCKGCRRAFLKGRRDQEFHDKRCFILTYKRNERGTPPERYGKPGRPKLERMQKQKENRRAMRAGKGSSK